ncbi:MAG: hypothetical protein A2857_05940 [Candidatus Levybacteria bacterium RIFCSPHIGHO2_01_FULL_36_15]|nr:MAG: hypothetical protein A2857_05940 [Candidatus Levybacteria bacterium RIFCSPHIGHO2_01_FULL_36_15]
MKKYFYSHIIEIDSIILELNKLDLSESEKTHLITLIDSSIHHVVLDAILSELSPEDKKIFLEHLSSDEHDKIWQLLNGKIENIENKIKKAAEALKEELRKDIKDTKENE